MKRQNLDQLIEQGYDFDIEEAFRNGWEMFKSKALVSMAYGILILSLQFMFAIHLGDLAVLFSVFLAAPLYSGFFLVANKISRNEEVRYSDFFGGFVYYIPIILVWVVGQIFAAVGLLLLIVPGVYLMVGYLFALLMAIFGGLDFWNSLEYSRRLIHVKWWKFFFLTLLLIILNVLGALLFVVGLIVTLPLTYYIIYCLFEEITQEALL